MITAETTRQIPGLGNVVDQNLEQLKESDGRRVVLTESGWVTLGPNGKILRLETHVDAPTDRVSVFPVPIEIW